MVFSFFNFLLFSPFCLAKAALRQPKVESKWEASKSGNLSSHLAVWPVNQAENWSKQHHVRQYTGHELASEKSYGDNRCRDRNLMIKSTILSHQIDFLSFPMHVYDQKHRKKH